MQRRLVSLVVNNQPGVLTRVAGLFTRRGYNIDSLTVSVTQAPALSRITVVVTADESMLQQVVRQVEKLIDVRVVQVLDDRECRPRRHRGHGRAHGDDTGHRLPGGDRRAGGTVGVFWHRGDGTLGPGSPGSR